MDYDLIVIKTLERVSKNHYYIIRGILNMKIEGNEKELEAMQRVCGDT